MIGYIQQNTDTEIRAMLTKKMFIAQAKLNWYNFEGLHYMLVDYKIYVGVYTYKTVHRFPTMHGYNMHSCNSRIPTQQFFG